jgi:hypothetical protein
VGNPLFQQLGRYLRWPRADPRRVVHKLLGLRSADMLRPQNDGQNDTELCQALIS